MKAKPDREAVLMIIDRSGNDTTVGYLKADLTNKSDVEKLQEVIRDAGLPGIIFDVFKTYKRSEK